MKIITTIQSSDAARAAEKIRAQWQDEHAHFYGKEHGKTCIRLALTSAMCGYDENIDVPVAGKPLISVPGFRWLTSGGNDHRIAIIDGDSVYIAYEGRRHGMRDEFREFLSMFWSSKRPGTGTEYVTQEESWAPWETREDK